MSQKILALALALLVAEDVAALLVQAPQHVSTSASLRAVSRGPIPSLLSLFLRARHDAPPPDDKLCTGRAVATMRAQRRCSGHHAYAKALCWPRSRRNVLVVTAVALATFAPAADAEQLPPGETQADGLSEKVRKAASKMPGMGPPDVVYPDGMLGRWRVQRVLADVNFPQGAAKADANGILARKGKVDTFAVRFITGEGGVVADREFNIRSLTSASEGADVSVNWKSSNPNVLTMQYPDGQLRETKVCAPCPVASVSDRPVVIARPLAAAASREKSEGERERERKEKDEGERSWHTGQGPVHPLFSPAYVSQWQQFFRCHCFFSFSACSSRALRSEASWCCE